MKVTMYVELLVVTALCITTVVHSYATHKRLKVLTYNTALIDKPLESSLLNNRIERRDGIIDALKNQDSDVVCLQEVFIGQDMELIVEGLKIEYPNSFSQLHIFDGTLPPQKDGYRRPPCDRTLLGGFSQCILDNSCVGIPIADFGTCVATNCGFQLRELMADGGSQCASCLVVTELANTIQQCSSDTASTGLRHMNPSGLLLLSKKQLKIRKFVEFYPSTVEFLSYGYITADIGNDIEVACTHLSPYEQYTGEFELGMYFPTYAAQTAYEIIHLIEVFSNRGNPTILLGDFNVGPGGRGHYNLQPFGSEHYDKLAASFDTSLISACTYCSGEQVIYNIGEEGTNTALDHVMVNCRNLKILRVTRMFTDRLISSSQSLLDLFLSDHFGVQASIIITR